MSETMPACPTDHPPDAFPAALITSFRFTKDLADRAIAQVPDARLHEALDPNTNSIAVIMQHLAGNLRSRWTDVFETDGEKPWRDRDAEFVDGRLSREALCTAWEEGWACVLDTLATLTPADVARSVRIRGEVLTFPQAACRALAHAGYHVGQIVMIARVLAGETWTTLSIPRGESRSYNERVWRDAGATGPAPDAETDAETDPE